MSTFEQKKNLGILSWLHQKIVVEKFNNLFGFLVLTLICVVFAMGLSLFGMKLGIMVIAAVVGVPIAIYGLINNKFALVLLTVLPAFLPIFIRIANTKIPFGIAIDGFLLLLFLGRIAMAAFSKEVTSTVFKNAVGIIIIVWVVYAFIQVGNPAGVVGAWAFGIREVLRFLMIFVIADAVIDNRKFLEKYTDIWIYLALIVALYGIYQELVGLPGFDMKWARATDERINLLFIGGKWRKWSILSDPAIFGLFMSFGGIVSLILAMGPFPVKRRIFYVIAGVLMFLSMLFSGTRTAYVIIPIGFMLYVLMNITKIRTLIFTVVAFSCFIILYFGPFHNPTLHRMRTAFNPSEDASFNLRDYNRAMIRPYVHSHPIGGGLATCGVNGERFARGHRLAGFPPDSGFMKTLLELGFVGLFLRLTMYAIILGTGITSYYTIRDPILKSYLIAFIVGFFALSISLIAKENIEQFPLNFILYCIFVCMYRIKDFDKPIENQNLE